MDSANQKKSPWPLVFGGHSSGPRLQKSFAGRNLWASFYLNYPISHKREIMG